jgi:hypothetical protein
LLKREDKLQNGFLFSIVQHKREMRSMPERQRYTASDSEIYFQLNAFSCGKLEVQAAFRQQ